MSDPYLWARLAHILSATLLFGTGLGTAFHFYAAHRRGDVAAIAVVSRNTVLADWLFIATTGVLQPLTGFLLIHLAGHDPLAGWLVLTYVLYVVAALCWLKAVELQYRVRRLARIAVERAAPLPDAYHAAIRLWFILGWPGFVSLILIFVLMVMKPAPW